MGITVLELHRKPFEDRLLDDKVKIVMEGPSRPKFSSHPIVGPNSEMLQLDEVVYSKAQWITGCPYRNGFFCWTCLLFGKAEWMYIRNKNKRGYSELLFLINIMLDHEKTAEHIESDFLLKMFCMQHVIKSPNEELEMNIKSQTVTVNNKNNVFKRLIDVVFKNVAQAANRREESYYGQLNVEECVNILQLTLNYDKNHSEEIDCAMELIKKSPTIVCDLVDAMTKIVKQAIKEETQLSTYVSLMLSEHSQMSSQSVVSTVLRYIKNGHVCERFVGFSPCNIQRTADDLCKHIGNIIVEFDISKRFLAYSVDGAIVSVFQLLKLVGDLKKVYPDTLFVPWYAHRLECVMQQSLSCYKECDKFFKTLNSIEMYFIKNSNLWQAFESLMHEKQYTLTNFDWFIKSETIDALYIHRRYFVEFFELVVQNSKKWDLDDVVKALGFKQFLQEVTTIFLLQVFSRLLDIMDDFRQSLQGNTSRGDSHVFNDFLNKVISERGIRFEKAWSGTIAEILEVGLNIPKTKKIYRELFNNIFHCTIRDLEIRYEAMSELELPCCITMRGYGIQDTYIDLYMAQGPLFDKEAVTKEVNILRENAAEFAFTSLEDLYQFFLQSNIKDAMPSVFEMAKFTLALPIHQIKCGEARFQEILSQRFNAEHMLTSGDISVLCLELDLLRDLKKTDSFYNDVVSAFDSRERTVD